MVESNPTSRQPNFIDITGKTYHEWTVVRRLRGQLWLCDCSCGRTRKAVRSVHLRQGNSKRCHLCRTDLAVKATRTGKSEFPAEYGIWCSMRTRCHNSNSQEYRWYGARGIVVCERWRRSFENFLTDMGPRPTARHTIERNDNDGNYCPGNCRWATYKENARNKRTNVMLTHDGRTQCVAAWAEETGIGRSTIEFRLKKGWPVSMALTAPVGRQGKKPS